MGNRDYFVRHDNGSFSGYLTLKSARKEVLFSRQESVKLPLEPTHLVISENSQIGCLWPRRRRTGTESFYVMIDDPSLLRPMMGILRRVGLEETFVLDKNGVGLSNRNAK